VGLNVLRCTLYLSFFICVLKVWQTTYKHCYCHEWCLVILFCLVSKFVFIWCYFWKIYNILGLILKVSMPTIHALFMLWNNCSLLWFFQIIKLSNFLKYFSKIKEVKQRFFFQFYDIGGLVIMHNRTLPILATCREESGKLLGTCYRAIFWQHSNLWSKSSNFNIFPSKLKKPL
jgi:hypothetical protein